MRIAASQTWRLTALTRTAQKRRCLPLGEIVRRAHPASRFTVQDQR
jgi:hypothetical protein